MKITNQLYDISKWTVLVFLPALTVLVGSLGELYSWANTSLMLTTMNLFTVFLGSLLQISSQKYHSRNNHVGGEANDSNCPE